MPLIPPENMPIPPAVAAQLITRFRPALIVYMGWSYVMIRDDLWGEVGGRSEDADGRKVQYWAMGRLGRFRAVLSR